MLTRFQITKIRNRRQQGFKVHAIAEETGATITEVRNLLRCDTRIERLEQKPTEERKTLIEHARQDIREGYDIGVVSAVYGLTAKESEREVLILARRILLAELKAKR